MCAAFCKIYPEEYLKRFVAQGVRPDGRSLTTARVPTIVTTSKGGRDTTASPHTSVTGLINTAPVSSCADGSAFVRMGSGTSAVAGIKLEVGRGGSVVSQSANLEPPSGTLTGSERDNSTAISGCNVVVNVEIGGMSNSKFRSAKDDFTRHTISSVTQRLNSIITRMPLFRPQDLWFDQEGKFVWYIFVDIYCVDYDGNAFDCCLLALLASLKIVELPCGTVSDDGVPLIVTKSPPRRLSLLHHPVSLTFAFFEDQIIADPTFEEELLSSGFMSIVYNEQGQLCDVYKPGGSPIEPTTLKLCLEYAKTRTSSVMTQLNSISLP
ncbi:exosc8 protein [Pelomyxa schiedti]|nr:exosc8 protein [Pelomyxa schiedti]